MPIPSGLTSRRFAARPTGSAIWSKTFWPSRSWSAAAAVDGREIVSPAALLDRLVPRLGLRARQAGMELVVGPVDCQTSVRVDLSVVDQILSNLVDNAVKYAGSASDRRIHLDVAPMGRWLAVTVRDHGPGLQPNGGPPAVPPIFKVGPGRRTIGAGRRSWSRPEPTPRPRAGRRPTAPGERFTRCLLLRSRFPWRNTSGRTDYAAAYCYPTEPTGLRNSGISPPALELGFGTR